LFDFKLLEGNVSTGRTEYLFRSLKGLKRWKKRVTTGVVFSIERGLAEHQRKSGSLTWNGKKRACFGGEEVFLTRAFLPKLRTVAEEGTGTTSRQGQIKDRKHQQNTGWVGK